MPTWQSDENEAERDCQRSVRQPGRRQNVSTSRWISLQEHINSLTEVYHSIVHSGKLVQVNVLYVNLQRWYREKGAKSICRLIDIDRSSLKSSKWLKEKGCSALSNRIFLLVWPRCLLIKTNVMTILTILRKHRSHLEDCQVSQLKQDVLSNDFGSTAVIRKLVKQLIDK